MVYCMLLKLILVITKKVNYVTIYDDSAYMNDY